MQRSPARKKTRLDRCILPVSSGEELNLVILQEQNKRLSRNYSTRVKLEEDLRSRIVKLEATLRECEDKNPEELLAIANKDLLERNEELEHQLSRSRFVEARLEAELAELQALNDQYLQQQQHQQQQNHHHHHHHLHSNPQKQQDRNHNNCNAHQTFSTLVTNNHSSSCSTTTPTTNTTASSTGLNHDHTSSSDQSTPDDGRNNHDSNNDNTITTNHNNCNNDAASSCSAAGTPNCCLGLGSSTSSSSSHHPHAMNTHSSGMFYTSKLDELQRMYQDEHELAEKRLRELEKLNDDHRKALTLIEELKQDLKSLPEHIISNTAEYKTLQSHFSVLWNEATQLKIQLDDVKKELHDSKSEHLRQIERMEAEELTVQQRLHNEINKLEDSLAIKSREIDKLQIDLESVTNAHSKMKEYTDQLKRQYNSLHHQLAHHRQVMNGATKSNNSSHSVSGSSSVKSSSKSTLDVDTLTHEIEITGQAYDELQEQYQRLLQQCSEKDEANFNLMAERLKANMSHKLMQEKERELIAKLEILEKQVEREQALISIHANKERLLSENVANLEKALTAKGQSIETHQQFALEAQQSLSELKQQKEKFVSQLKELQESLSDKTDSLQQERFKCKRLNEELESWRRKYERAKKFESASTADEVLLEEVREYKEQLTCPSCKTKPKDAVLTKCFHVFCFDCLKVRVETRQRKCPKCNAQFGVNDFHRLYLA